MVGTVLREILARFGIEVDTKELDSGNKKVDDFSKKLEKFGKAVAGVFVLTGVTNFVKRIFEESDAMYLAAQRAGMTVEAYQGLSHTTEMLNVSTQNLGVGIKYLHRNLALAAAGNKKLKETFNALGVSIEEGVPNDAEEAFRTIADGIKNIKDENLQTAMSMKVFGRSGALLLPVMKAGSETIKQYSDEVKELGGGFTTASTNMADSWDDQMKRQKIALRSVRVAILDTIIPALKLFTDGVTSVALAFVAMNKHGESARFVIVAALIAITAACWPLVAALTALALPAAKIIALALVIEDLYVLFRGGKSLVGQLGDKIDSTFSLTAALVGKACEMMSLSWSNLTIGLLVAWQFLGFSIGAVFLEVVGSIAIGIAKIEDLWNGLIRKISQKFNLPPWVSKLLRIGDYEADAKSGKSHEQQTREGEAEIQRNWFESFRNDPAMKNYQAAMGVMKQSEALAAQNEKALALAAKYGGSVTDYAPGAGGRNTPGQRKLLADEKRSAQVRDLSKKYGGKPEDYWKNQAPASGGMLDALRKVASGQDAVKAKQARTLLESGQPVSNRQAYKLLAPQMLPETDRPKGFVEQPFQSKFFPAPETGPVTGALAAGQVPSKTVAPTTNISNKTYTDNSVKTITLQVGKDQKDKFMRIARDMANEGLRGKMDRDFADPTFETDD